MHASWNKGSSQSPLILFATPPPLELLRTLTIRISAGGSQTGSKFQPQVIKCREFIFTEPEVIGSPSVDIKDNCFHLVAQLSLLNSGRLQARLTRVGLEVTKPYAVTPELYQACLRYTLLARISPNWNRAGQWLIQGRDFLTHAGCTNAVKMDVTVCLNELYFTLEATAVKLSPLQVTDLDLVGNCLQKFLTNPGVQIEHSSIASDWCFVLPSMKKGRIMSISHDIPEDSPFMSYRDLKRHWKNTYGYRLPDTEDNMNFYQIHFGPLGGKLFTYPEVCLRSREIQRVARVDPKPILRDFMKEIQSKFPTICGYPMKLQSKAKFTVADLFESGQRQPASQPNLTNKIGVSRPAVYRSKSEMELLLSTQTPSAAGRDSQSARPATNQTSAIRQIHEQTSYSDMALKNTTMQGNCKQNTNTPSHHVQILSKSRQLKQSVNQLGFHPDNNDKSTTPKHFSYAPHHLVQSGMSENVAVPIRSISSSKATPDLNFTQPEQSANATHRMITPVQNFPINSSNNCGNSERSACDFDTPSHAIISASQAPVVRKLFPHFKPKMMYSATQISNTFSQSNPASRMVPSFDKQRRLKAVQVSGNSVTKDSSITSRNTSFNSDIRGVQCQNVYTGHHATLNVQQTAAVPTFQKVAPSFQRSTSSLVKKSTTNVGQKSSMAKAEKQNGKTTKGEKSVKRSRESKKENKGESRKKKMKKAEV